jgi:Protein of unknown function (DUF2510)/Domain of unknown function (DUF4352)
MTTPPTPAGWYPDPDGAGGQRYWDGSAWTEHRSPGAPPAPLDEPEPGPTAPIAQRIPPPVEPTFAPPPPLQPGPPPTIESDNRQLIVWFSAACAALLAVLVLVLVYALFLHDPDTVQVATPTTAPAETTTEQPPTTETSAPGGGDLSPTTETEPRAGGQATDGPLSFTVTGVETGTTVTSTDAPVEKTAQGEYIVVRVSVINTSDAPAQFLGTLQKLHAGDTTYNNDDEATFFVGGGFVEIPPGGEALVGVAYDVPPGTVAESIELHVDPLSPGVQLPL